MKNKLLYTLIFTFIISGCVSIESQTPEVILPNFVTATLPSTPIPQPTNTPLPPTPAPTISPINGTTTTKVNVRAETSSASDNLGTVDQFSAVQVIGRDETGSWYKIIYSSSPNGAGWVRTDYIQVDTQIDIPFINEGSQFGTRGLVTQRINIRNGPGTEYDTVGVLNPKDVIKMIGRNSDASWIQIKFANSDGWLSAQYLEGDSFESLPVADDAKEDESAETSNEPITPQVSSSLNDGDSRETPVANLLLGNTGSRTTSIDGTLSKSSGDIEDWVKFSSDIDLISIKLTCNIDGLQLDIWEFDNVIDTISIKCGGNHLFQVQPKSTYWLRITNSTEEINPITYNLSIKVGN